MKCFIASCVLRVLLMLCVPSVLARNLDIHDTNFETDCGSVKSFFESRNETVFNAGHDKGSICGGRCCNSEMESSLRVLGRRDLEVMVRHHARSLHGLLATTALTLQDHVTELARQSENKTLYLFSQVYQRMSVLSREPISALYRDIRNYTSNSSGTTTAPSLDIEASVANFFTDLYPLVYHHAVNLQQKDFSEDYKTCLRQTIKDIQPFGDIPRQISNSIFKSLEATRVLLQALSLGAEVLDATDTLLTEEAERADSPQSACHVALLKMSHCPKCSGLDTQIKPCSGYCLNVLRGCLTQHVAELDLPWNGYVEAVERLVIAVKTHDGGAGVNVESVIKALDTRISEAIMYAMENGPTLEKKVKRACGHARLAGEATWAPKSAAPGDSAPGSGERTPQRMPPRPKSPAVSPPDTQMLHFLASVATSKGFFPHLADALCGDENFAEQIDDVDCWNGDRIGEYTKTVVGSSASFQKYNPEVEVSTGQPMGAAAAAGEEDTAARVAKLSNKLLQMRLAVMGQISASSPLAESYMQGDEAGVGGVGGIVGGVDGVEGSGSGRPEDRFTEDDSDGQPRWSGSDTEGSGSGYGGIEDTDTSSVEIKKTSSPHSKVPGETSSSSIRVSVSPVLLLSSLFFFHHWTRRTTVVL